MWRDVGNRRAARSGKLKQRQGDFTPCQSPLLGSKVVYLVNKEKDAYWGWGQCSREAGLLEPTEQSQG